MKKKVVRKGYTRSDGVRVKPVYVNLWIQEAVKDNSKGDFTAKAKRAGMETKNFMKKVINDYQTKDKHTKAETKTYRQAILMRTLMGLKK